MTTNTTTIENERLMQLQETRNSENLVKSKIDKIKEKLNIPKKLAKHWLILSFAALFDLIGAIPFIAPLINFIWGGVLYLKFGSKKIGKTFLTIGVGSIADFFPILSFLPVCIVATVIRIISE